MSPMSMVFHVEELFYCHLVSRSQGKYTFSWSLVTTCRSSGKLLAVSYIKSSSNMRPIIISVLHKL